MRWNKFPIKRSSVSKYGYAMSSGFVVNRFDGTGSWKDDM